MKFAVVTLGSAGDLHPFLAIARGLARRGHDVRLLSQTPYEAQSLAEGVPFTSVVDTATHERTLKHPQLWHPLNVPLGPADLERDRLPFHVAQLSQPSSERL